jgi:hypothetical protein
VIRAALYVAWGTYLLVNAALLLMVLADWLR